LAEHTGLIETHVGNVAPAVDTIAGRGVRALRAIRAGHVIERCPVIVIPPDEMETIDETALYGYAYEWDDGYAFALGYGSLYNHSSTPNAEWHRVDGDDVIEIIATTDIAAGDEVRFDYSRGTGEVWFDPLD
jgi:SET domain-containing protein